MRILVLVLTVLLIATSPQSKAQDTKTWVGKKVVFKERARSPIMTKDQPGPKPSEVFTVKRANRDLLFIVIGEAGFWVPSRELILQDGSSVDLTEQSGRNTLDAQAYSKLGFSRLGKKDYDNAIANFDEVIRLTPKDARAFYGRALAWKRKRNFARAIADFNSAIQLDPRYAAAYNERAWLWATCTDVKYRDASKAVESARKACALSSGPSKAAYLDTLAAAYAEAGDFAGAVKAQAEANELFAGNEQRRRGGLRMILYQEKKPYRE